MKNFLILIAVAGLLFSCNNNSPSEKEPAVHDHQESPKTEQAENTEPVLALNNGEKWKADESTNSNVASLNKTMANFRDGKEKSMEDYKALQGSLQSGIEKMVKECKMKGPDHDALHLWLEPLMKMVKQLGDTTSTTEAATVAEKIDTQINMYAQYFI